MTQIDHLTRRLHAKLPSANVSVDKPLRSRSAWTVDVEHRDRAVTLVWRPYRGFGISLRDDVSYGEGPLEVVSSVDDAVGRTVELLGSRGETRATPAMSLAELREALQLTQGDLARRLGVSQSTISELERDPIRSKLTTVLRVLGALGARVEVRAVLPDERIVSLALPDSAPHRK
ncbi:MAG: helix-turn-helix transcriptional regulator [Planctomycetes bacterium]|nr:helix-turn-helix transcriptional regulator [Planctomycetota bacterium]